MNKILIFIAVLSYNFTFAQDTIFFKDKTSKTGKVKEINETVVRFIPDGSTKRIRYTRRDIERAIINIDGKNIDFVYDKVPFVGKVFLGKLISGKVNLYVTEKYIFGGNAYSYNQDDLAKYFCLYENLMSFWHDLFPGKIYDLSYENLTGNQEKETPWLYGNKLT